MRVWLPILLVAVAAVAGFTTVALVLNARPAPDDPPPATKPAPPKATPGPATPAASGKPTDPPAAGDPNTGTPEELPDPPKADPKSKLTPLLKDAKTFYLETKPDGGKRVLVATEICARQDMLEVFLCKKDSKEHESVVRTDVPPKLVHAALVACGAEVGHPVQYLNPKTMEEEFKPPAGQKIKVTVHYKKGGELRTHPAQEWILDKAGKKPMAYDWVFAGSRFIKDPDRPKDEPYYMANNGEMIVLSNFIDAMLDLPVEVSKSNDDLQYVADMKKLPPLGSKVWVILEPVPEAKKDAAKK